MTGYTEIMGNPCYWDDKKYCQSVHTSRYYSLSNYFKVIYGQESDPTLITKLSLQIYKDQYNTIA